MEIANSVPADSCGVFIEGTGGRRGRHRAAAVTRAAERQTACLIRLGFAARVHVCPAPRQLSSQR